MRDSMSEGEGEGRGYPFGFQVVGGFSVGC